MQYFIYLKFHRTLIRKGLRMSNDFTIDGFLSYIKGCTQLYVLNEGTTVDALVIVGRQFSQPLERQFLREDPRCVVYFS